MVLEHPKLACMHSRIVQHLFGTYFVLEMTQIPGNSVANKINVIFVLPQNFDSIGAWTDGVHVNTDNFKYNCHSIIIIKLVNMYLVIPLCQGLHNVLDLHGLSFNSLTNTMT